MTDDSSYDKVHRIRRQSAHDDWPQCFCCLEDMASGYEFHPSDRDTYAVCDNCLSKARKSPIGYCVDGEVSQNNLIVDKGRINE